MTYGDYPPPLGVIPSPALSRADIEFYYLLGQAAWVAKHAEKNGALSQIRKDLLSEEMKEIEVRQQKLAGML